LTSEESKHNGGLINDESIDIDKIIPTEEEEVLSS